MRSGVGASPYPGVSQSFARGSEGPLSGRGGCGTGRPPVERRMLRLLRRYLWPRRQGEGDAADRGGYSESPGFPRSRPPRG